MLHLYIQICYVQYIHCVWKHNIACFLTFDQQKQIESNLSGLICLWSFLINAHLSLLIHVSHQHRNVVQFIVFQNNSIKQKSIELPCVFFSACLWYCSGDRSICRSVVPHLSPELSQLSHGLLGGNLTSMDPREWILMSLVTLWLPLAPPWGWHLWFKVKVLKKTVG